MNAIAATLRPIPFPSLARFKEDLVTQAFTLLRIGFVVLPILMGLDKFAEVMNENWTAYLASEFNDIIPGNAQDAMYAVGVVEILAGLVVLVVPRFGGLLVAAWLGGIILSLLLGRRLRRHCPARFRPAARRSDAVSFGERPAGFG